MIMLHLEDKIESVCKRTRNSNVSFIVLLLCVTLQETYDG